MGIDRYKTFSAEDFILDEDFRRIINNPLSDSLLGEFFQDFPERKEEIMLAAKILEELRVKKFTPSEARKKELWEKIIGT